MASVPADIEMPDDDAPPSIAFARDAFPVRPVFAVVVPPRGSEENARLLALCTLSGGGAAGAVFHSGPRPAPSDVRAFWVDTVSPDSVARLFERGGHPGDLRLSGAPPDRYGRQPVAVLTFLDLSQGLAGGDRLSTPWEMRLALARVFAAAKDRAWKAAADVLDPAGLMRSGTVATPDGNPMTREGFGAFMRDGAAKADRRMDVSSHPIRDFRLLATEDLSEEIVREARAVLYGAPDLPPDGPATALLKGRIGDFVEALRSGGDYERAHTRLQTALALAVAPGAACPAIRRLVEGRGPGAVCWRNLFAANGMVLTALRRARAPETARNAEAVAKLPEWARRAVQDPTSVLTARPRTLDHVPGMLGDRHRPYLALPATRMAVAPGLLNHLAEMPKGHAEALLANTSLLLSAMDEIENLHAWLPEARDSLAVGWHALARVVAEADPDRAASLADRAPAFLTEGAMSRQFLDSSPVFHRAMTAPQGPSL